MLEVASRASLQFIRAAEITQVVEQLLIEQRRLGRQRPVDGWGKFLDEAEPSAIRGFLAERGWGRVPIALHNNLWLEYLGKADACLLDLRAFHLRCRGLNPGEDRISKARQLKEARDLVRKRTLSFFAENKVLYLPTRLTDAERVRRSLDFLETLTVVDRNSEAVSSPPKTP